jgi:hypothetical protein
VEPHICEVVNRTTDSRGEYVEIGNGGVATVVLTGLELTDYTRTQQHVHIYRFPSMTDDKDLILTPGQIAFVFTGSGRNQRSDRRNWLLFQNRTGPIWNDDGDVASVPLRVGSRVLDR